MENRLFWIKLFFVVTYLFNVVRPDNGCVYVCSSKNCTFGYLPIGCPRCQCAPDPCRFSQCPQGYICQSVPQACPYQGQGCPHKAQCVPNVKNGEQPCGCKNGYNPVCGLNGMNYANDCTRICAGVIKYSDGYCRNNCPRIYQPVCASNGLSYENDCLRQYGGVGRLYEGLCPCRCDLTSNPVCGQDGQTYLNACIMECAGVPLAQKGSCDCIRNCPIAASPVCGSDYMTYYNDCFRHCANVFLYLNYACPANGKKKRDTSSTYLNSVDAIYKLFKNKK